MNVTHNHPGTRPGPSELFTGQVFMDQVASAADGPQQLQVLKVHFTPGGRTAWHSHPVGQVLYVLDGVGRVQERGGTLFEIRAGDSVVTGPDVWHWHGASPDGFMTHVAIQQSDPAGREASFADQVSDAEYHAEAAKP